MKRSILFFAAALLAGAASATCPKGVSCNPPPSPIQAPVQSTSSSSASSSSESTSSAGASSLAQVGVVSSPSSSSTASGGSVGAVSQSFEEFSRSNLYVLPAPAQAAPLPPGLCPQGDSMSIGILWNLFSYARSSTRSEMECLDRVLNAWRQAPKVEIVHTPLLAPPPVEAPIQKKAAPAKRSASAPVKAKSKPAACAEAARQCKIPAK